MFDLGWQEFMMVAVVLMLVVGPKDLPRILRSFSQFMRKAKGMANEFTSSLEDVARQDEIRDMKNMMSDMKTGNFDDMANMIGGDIKEVAEGFSDVQEDMKSIATSGDTTKPAEPIAKKTVAKKKAAKKAVAKKTAAKKAAKS
jgi:sec-independent protein translocase protein TatB